MNKLASFPGIILFVAVLVFLNSCGTKQERQAGYSASTRTLIHLLDSLPEMRSLLEKSLAKAREINPNKDTNPAQSLEAYYNFISHCEKNMPWQIRDKESFPDIYNNTMQSLLAFYFLIDQPLPELDGKGYHHNSLQYAEPFALWLAGFTKSWGQYLDTSDSWNDSYYQKLYADPSYGLQQDWYEDRANWSTFNEFFARHLRSPDKRPITSPDDPGIVASFADSEPQGVWVIDESSTIVIPEGVAVKTATVKSVSKFIGDDSAFKDAFANGTFTHSFLNVNDYHRYHFPVGGIVKEVRVIQGINPTGGSIWWDATNNRYAFDPSAVGWQTVETRGCVIVETPEYGLVALLPIGMAAVGSVNFEKSVMVGAEVHKGDPLGYFLFGGSDFVLLFQDKVNFTLEAPKSDNGQGYKHMLMGERLGSLTKRKQ